MRDGCELDELRLHVLLVTEANQCAFVAHLVAVIWSTEDGDAFAIVLDDVTLILHLV